MFRRVNGKLVKTRSKAEILVKNGRQMAVLRPLTPEAAKAALDEALAMVGKPNNQEAFNEIVSKQDQMIFAGLASTKARLLDPQTLEDIGPILPGDSFIAVDDLDKFERVAST